MLTITLCFDSQFWVKVLYVNVILKMDFSFSFFRCQNLEYWIWLLVLVAKLRRRKYSQMLKSKISYSNHLIILFISFKFNDNFVSETAFISTYILFTIVFALLRYYAAFSLFFVLSRCLDIKKKKKKWYLKKLIPLFNLFVDFDLTRSLKKVKKFFESCG